MSEELTTETEKPSKLNSRKFLIWIVWGVITLALTVMGFVRDNDALVLKALEYFFYITLFYFGVNVASKGLHTYEEVKQ